MNISDNDKKKYKVVKEGNITRFLPKEVPLDEDPEFLAELAKMSPRPILPCLQTRPPRLAVIIPCYNQAHLLSNAVAAIMKSSQLPNEIWITDDCSTDDSWGKICFQYSLGARPGSHPLFRLFRNPTNIGGVRSVNDMLSVTECDYVMFTSCDDTIHPDFIQKSMTMLCAYPRAGLCFTNSKYTEVETGLTWNVGLNSSKPCYIEPEKLCALERKGLVQIASNACIFKTAAIKELNGFKPSLGSVADWYAIMNIAYRDGVCCVPEQLAYFHIHKSGYWNSVRNNPQVYNKVLYNAVVNLTDNLTRWYVRKSGALYIHGWPVIPIVWRNARDLFTLNLLIKTFIHSFKRWIKRFVPVKLGNLYLRITT